jgi:hypothetical protein
MANSVRLKLFLPPKNLVKTPSRTILCLLAPAITAGGFAWAAAVYDRLLRKRGRRLRTSLLWPMSATVLGALLVYWFGPMLTVFSMLAAGTLAIAWLEAAHTIRGA